MRAQLVAIIALLALLVSAPFARASSLGVKSGSDTGGGAIVGTGSGTASPSSGSSSGVVSFWLDFGSADASDFPLTGGYELGPDVFPTTTPLDLRVIATVPEPCPSCFFLSDAKLGSLQTDDPSHPAAVEFATVGIPEPASLILLGSGLVGLAIAARRRRRRRHIAPAAPDKLKLPR